jgi:serine/threonine protein kinase
MPYIAMRYLGGGSLEDMIRRAGPLPLEALERPLRQIAQALDHAHGQGIIHRDLKPGNIMMDEGGNAYLSDFGIARVMGSEMTGSMIIGTPSYMSPEQANGLPIDSRADVYSLGVVLFELITGRLPFEAETPMAVLLKHINEDVPPIKEFRDDVSSVVEDVVRRATAKEPTGRFPSAGDMASAFSKALHDETAAFDRATEQRAGNSLEDNTLRFKPDRQATIPPASGRTPTPTPRPRATPAASADEPAEPRRSSNRLLLGLGALVVIAAATVGAFLVLSSANGEPVDVNAVPTPFPRANTFTGNQFTVSMPSDWINIQDRFTFNQFDRATAHNAWVNTPPNRPGVDTIITVTLVDADLKGDQTFFEIEVNDFVREHYNRRIFSTVTEFIDQSTAEDGTIRRSYRIELPEDREEFRVLLEGDHRIPIRSGQIDLFFMQQAPYLVVIEMYTSDVVGGDDGMVARLQSILDSLRIQTTTS